MSVTETSDGVTITARCDGCGDGVDVPDKGLGRATLAAWKTQHQDCGNGVDRCATALTSYTTA